jgi:ectoine hydroxylase-related dioxygenase (phytanoyl-CoA dioxygenase family)
MDCAALIQSLGTPDAPAPVTTLPATTEPPRHVYRQFSLQSDEEAEMLAFFRRFGYLSLRDGLAPETAEQLRDEVWALDQRQRAALAPARRRRDEKDRRHAMTRRFFEQSRAMVDVVRGAPVVDLVQSIIADVPGGGGRGNGLRAHLIHNNAFVVPPGGRGQAPVWHTDDVLQGAAIAQDAPVDAQLPDWLELPALAVTCVCWLSDCDSAAAGPTFVVPGSHRFGRAVDAARAERLAVPACGQAGTVVIVNNQLWHRGSAVAPEAGPRVCMQMTFARRMIGHKFGSIMNYRLPDHVHSALTSDRDHERFGFLEGGAYS